MILTSAALLSAFSLYESFFSSVIKNHNELLLLLLSFKSRAERRPSELSEFWREELLVLLYFYQPGEI